MHRTVKIQRAIEILGQLDEELRHKYPATPDAAKHPEAWATMLHAAAVLFANEDAQDCADARAGGI